MSSRFLPIAIVGHFYLAAFVVSQLFGSRFPIAVVPLSTPGHRYHEAEVFGHPKDTTSRLCFVGIGARRRSASIRFLSPLKGKSIVYVHTKVSNRVLDLAVAEQNLNRSKIACGFVDD